MSLPATDDFNRVAELPLSNGGRWTNPGGASDSQLQVFLNQVFHNLGGGTLLGWMYWNDDVFSADQYSQLTMVGRAGTDFVGIGARMQTGAIQSGYFAGAGSATGIQEIDKCVAGVNTTFGTGFAYANGDVMKLTVIGTELKLYINGAFNLTATDGTFASGAAGIVMYATASTSGDNWEAGNVASSYDGSLFPYYRSDRPTHYSKIVMIDSGPRPGRGI